MQQFSRPQEAREIEARGRARDKGARVEVIETGHHYRARSLSRPGRIHELHRTPAGWKCSCEGYTYTGSCLHLGQLQRRLDRERQSFGRIAPRVVA